LICIVDSWRDEFDHLLKSKNKILKKLFEESTKKYNPNDANNIFSKQFESDERHDNLLNICISAFTPGSKCCDNLEYYFISSEPLIELNVKNFDILIINKSKKYAIFVECKSSINKGYVADGYEAIANVISNKDHLQKKIGNEIDIMEFVFCVPPSQVNRLIKQIEITEVNCKIDPEKDSIFLIWQLDRFKGQKLQLLPNIKIKTRSSGFSYQHSDRALTAILAKGIDVTENEFVVDTYPSSNACSQGRALISKIIIDNTHKINEENRQRLLNNLGELTKEEQDKIRKTFSKDFVYRYFQSNKTLAHYDSTTVGKKLAEHFIGESLKFEFIESIDQGNYILKMGGKELHTILNNYENKYKEKFLNEKAAKEAFDEYRRRVPKISDYL
jgi:hypothetical protein